VQRAESGPWPARPITHSRLEGRGGPGQSAQPSWRNRSSRPALLVRRGRAIEAVTTRWATTVALSPAADRAPIFCGGGESSTRGLQGMRRATL
jgi:hypothetical protein